MRFFSFFLFPLVMFISSCGKNNGTGSPAPVTPTNLTLTANISTDNSGNVAFIAAATNAASYDYDFGNGTYQTVSSGSVTYKYPSAGTYTVVVIAKSTTGHTISKSIQITVGITQSLVFSDEFDVPGAPNPAKWGYDIGGGGWGNAELQYYTNRVDNSIVSGGTLKIIAKKETFSGSAYTSARLLTKDKFSFMYGKVEVRAKLPSGGGVWPAIWTLGSNINTTPWPACGEMDIMEHKGNEVNKIYGTLHYPGRSGGNGNGNTTTISNAATEFHKYSLEWSASTIKILVDDVVFHTVANTASLPFNQNFFVILNFAIGGTFGGAVDPAFTSGVFEIDYVRVYQ